MDIEKRASKGGFLQLFDWNVKSRKKLFSNKSELLEDSKQGKENVANSMILCPHLMEGHESGPGLSGKGSSDFNFASRVSGDEGYGTRAPGVVARLMGLDSLPNSNSSESCSTPFCDSPFVRGSHSQRSTSNFQMECHIVNEIPIDGNSRNHVKSRIQKTHNLPIERFQIETLPPKSAKSIPITHHRMLSPIKSPGFVPTNNVAYIMEAAAKIIEQGPPSTRKGKMPHFGSSSIPLRIRDLKERMESTPKASRRPKEPNSVSYMKGQHSERNQMFDASAGSLKDSSDNLKKKGKSVSLAIQAKVNVQRREEFTSSSIKGSINQKEGNEVKLGQFKKNQTNVQKVVQKRTSMGRTSDVLRQNNQKQNCVANKDRVASKASVSNQQNIKFALSSNGSIGPNKVKNSVVGSRKMNSVVKVSGKEHQSSKPKILSGKKQPVHKNINFQKIVAKNVVSDKDQTSVRCNVASDGCMSWDTVDRQSSMDVVSFTFTSPNKRSAPGLTSSAPLMEKNTHFCVDSSDDNDPNELKKLSSLGLNVIGGDALSVLLEQKLKELTCRVESSQCNLVEAGSAVCSALGLQDSLFTLNMINTVSPKHENSFQLNLHEDKSSRLYDIDCSSVDKLLKANQKCQGLEELEGHSSSSNNSGRGKELDCQYPSPVSSLEPSSSGGSCCSSDSKTSSITNGKSSNQFLLAKHLPVEVETELSDSASSMSGNDVTATTFSLIDFKRSCQWELEFITKTLCNAELILDDFVLGQVNNVMTPNLFDRLENQRTGFNEDVEQGCFKLGRKVLFDSVSECLELRCERFFGGSFKASVKWATLFQRKGWLAEELHKEISSWASMGDLMVDELVDKDMSCWHGRWVDFETEAFEEGVEIEKGILTSLVDELVVDLFFI
ncbi:uncharacterized protein LOC114283028 isoform X1 [Camellia sinensis]|uniref:uncharacterized protein LOC114283028 isoform X1 n=1 Tax=Camellia sinensis TaxID=4442 RepID=UPI001036AA51|nr:uncharacterized protein LOC114283028 isoform X1 [Camellia sinensis]XP_028081633.1 uncharacterized protein LOC114283028 isoform X1 [Camellia sinensis]XP_028081634.1 uncharacterized protein LOC114283028 isoform X1 [Camellia sinensis]